MASLQSIVLKRYMRVVKSLIVRRGKHKDVPFLRRGMSMSASRAKMPKDVEISFFTIGNIPATWFKPKESDPKKVLLYLHGGGYAVGSVHTHKSLISKIAKSSGIIALGIDYRLAPEHPFPAALNDTLEAYQFLLDEGYDSHNICFAGDSAGGGLTLAGLVAIRDRELPMPSAAIGLSPWTDLEGNSHSAQTKDDEDPMIKASELAVWGANYAGNYSIDHPLISPMYANLTGLPPLLIQVGTSEVLEDDSILFADKAKEAGVKISLEVWEDMIHVWHFFWPYLPEGEKAIKKIAKFIHEHVGQTQEV